MGLPPDLLRFAGSLIAILLLAGLAWSLKLGPQRRLDSDDAAREAAHEALDGFEPVAVARDREGRAALLRDADDRLLLIRQHGTHFAGRLLDTRANARIEEGSLTVDCGERRYGAVRLAIADPETWRDAIARL